MQASEGVDQAKVFKARAVPQGVCGNWMNAFEVLEVGHLWEGLRSFKVQRPKGEEGNPEVPVRESPGELTLEAEEMGTWKSCINVDHIAKGRWTKKAKAL